VLSAAFSGANSIATSLWVSCLDRVRPSLDVRDFEEDVALLLRRLVELESLVSASGPETEDCLREAGQWRLSQRRSRGLIKAPG
jgi:hypothetical protein